jgi:16S rRNA processing protein RimM
LKYSDPTWIKIGVVGRPNGLRGAFYISYRDDVIPKTYQHIWIGESPQKSERYEIRISKMLNGRPLIECASIARREQAELLVGMPIWVQRAQISIDESKSYLWSDLVGKVVKDANGYPIGSILEIRNFGASDIVAVRNERGEIVEVPMVPVYFDMSFGRSDLELKLVVAKEVFDGLWSKIES